MLHGLPLCKLAQKHVQKFLLYRAIVWFTAHRLTKLFRNKTKYFYCRQTLFVLLIYFTKQSSQLLKKFPTFYRARRSITTRQTLFSSAHNFVKMFRNNTKHFYSRQLSLTHGSSLCTVAQKQNQKSLLHSTVKSFTVRPFI